MNGIRYRTNKNNKGSNMRGMKKFLPFFYLTKMVYFCIELLVHFSNEINISFSFELYEDIPYGLPDGRWGACLNEGLHIDNLTENIFALLFKYR